MLIVVVGGIEIGKGPRVIRLRFEIDTWGITERSRALTCTLLTDIPPQSLEKGVVLVVTICHGSVHALITPRVYGKGFAQPPR